MSRYVVFVGPTLPPAEVTGTLPAADVLPPVRHGDLLRLDVRAGDVVLLIDGLFLQAAAVRHREIMYLLQRGVTVAGSSSMGALRAAELWPFGMRGFGTVFRLYRDGDIDGDDEVAVVHGTAEDGYRAYSDPLVSIRVALAEAVAAEAVGASDARRLIDLARAMPFRSRSFRALDMAASGHVAPGALAAFRSWRSAHYLEVKAADARLLLAAAAAGGPGLHPAGAGDQPVRHVHTWLFDQWEHRFHGAPVDGEWVADADAATAIRLAHPEFRGLHRRHVLARAAGVDPDHPALTERATAAARARGLLDPGPGADPADSWLTEQDLARAPDDALATLLVRAFGVPQGRLPSQWDLPPRLRTPAALAWGREVVAAARRCHERLGSDAIDRAIARWWGCDPADLQWQAWDRGIAGLAALRRLAEPFGAYLASGGPRRDEVG